MAVAPAVLKMRLYFVVAALALLAACAAGSGSKPAPGAAPPPAGPALDASYDWRTQVTVPFGTLLKSTPVPLHEVLLFHDDAPDAGAPGAAATGGAASGVDAESRDCYTIDGAPPRLVGQTPADYLLCFDHDRLNRIESTVHLAPDSAAQVFARACASWQAAVTPASAAAPALAGPSASAAGDACEGRSGPTSITAHLASEPGQPATLSLVLSNTGPVP